MLQLNFVDNGDHLLIVTGDRTVVQASRLVLVYALYAVNDDNKISFVRSARHLSAFSSPALKGWLVRVDIGSHVVKRLSMNGRLRVCERQGSDRLNDTFDVLSYVDYYSDHNMWFRECDDKTWFVLVSNILVGGFDFAQFCLEPVACAASQATATSLVPSLRFFQIATSTEQLVKLEYVREFLLAFNLKRQELGLPLVKMVHIIVVVPREIAHLWDEVELNDPSPNYVTRQCKLTVFVEDPDTKFEFHLAALDY